MFGRRSYLEASVAGGVGWRRPILLNCLLGCAAALSVLVAGCGNQYRPVVSAINPVGPAGQPAKYAVAISSPSASSPGLLTFVDFSGDTVLTTPQILSNPNYLALAPGGSQGYVINSAGSINEFAAGSPTSLLSSDIGQSTLSVGSSPVSITAISLAGTNASVFVPEPALSQVAALTGTGSLEQNIGVPNNPIYVVGANSAARAYVISEGDKVTPSTVSSVESGNLAVSSTIPVGIDPVYGVMTADGKRAFILNKGSGTVNVINVVNNGKDLAMPVIPATGTLGQGPVWADLSPLTNQLIVLNQGDGVHPGSLSIINIPLCSTASPATNPNCDPANPVDAVGFGTVLATVPVGINPVMVSVLQDGTKAYVANQGNAAAGVEGSVSVVNLVSGTVSATIPGISSAAATSDTNTTPTEVYGHPTTIAATTGTPTGKVYVTSSDNKFMTVIETDTDTVTTHVNLQGLGVRVAVTAQ
ncbi:MAG TPA: YncE family protein [Acidobacteriaceae bacterium]|nr:YncE family protein [Acidobacteriaceae bacterium]